jgi:4'-phosphopantetheinyl transferase
VLAYIRPTMSVRPAAGKPRHHCSLGPWTTGPHDPVPAPATIDVWRVALTAVGERVLDALSAQERERAANIVGQREQRLWSRSRGVLRDLLGRYLDADPSSLELDAGTHGKPRLAAPWSERGLHFNLSHSGELALYAFSANGSVGADVEVMREPGRRASTDPVALAARFLGAEAAARLRELTPPSRELELLRLWTRHEAELKRRGTGIGAAAAAEQADGEARVEPWIVELDVGAGAVAALAAERGAARELRLWEWTARRS